MKVTYRMIQNGDAKQFWNLMNTLDYETKYMMYEPGERSQDLSRIESVIQSVEEAGNFLLLAMDGTKMIGYISAERGQMARIRHSAYIVVGILKEYRGKGIGTEFFKRVDSWAQKNSIVRLELTVMCPNEAARHLYEKSGFVIEGTKKKSMLVDGAYVDEYYMAKLL